MQPEDDIPPIDYSDDDQEEPGKTMPISRDTLVLVGALIFLMITVALTFLFTSGTDQVTQIETTTTPSSTLGGGSPNPSSGTTTPSSYPKPGRPSPYPGQTEGTARPTRPSNQETEDAYPDASPGARPTRPRPTRPTDEEEQTEEPYPSPDDGPTTRPRPTHPPDGEEETAEPYPGPSPVGPTVEQPTPYPAPTALPPPTDTPDVAPPTEIPTEEPPTEEPPTEEPPIEEPPTEEPPIEEPPTEEPTATSTETPTLTLTPSLTPTEAPTEVPIDVITGDTRWRSNQSPIVLENNVQIAPGASLVIEPGVEVRLGQAVSIFVDENAHLLALGESGRPVRLVSHTGARWEGLFGRRHSRINLEYTEVSGGGSGGTLLTSEFGELVLRHARVSDNGGTILVNDSKLEVRDSEVTANDIAYGAAINASYDYGNFVTLTGNRVSGNVLKDGAPNVRVTNNNNLDTLLVDVQGNVLRGGLSGNIELTTNGPIKGVIACNAFLEDNLGLSLRTQTLQLPGFNLAVMNNLIDRHTPPIDPIYLEYGIGRGATSEIALDMRQNWWGDPSGPYDPVENPEGRGDSVGVNISYRPWLESPPACIPTP